MGGFGSGRVTYEEWEAQVPAALRQDSLWKMRVYRLGLFLSDLAWRDARKVAKHRLAINTADQLFRAASNISSNVSEGYSRGTGKDRARFYEYALGSARECRDWYYKCRPLLATSVVDHRLQLCTDVIRLLLKIIPGERAANRRIQQDA